MASLLKASVFGFVFNFCLSENYLDLLFGLMCVYLCELQLVTVCSNI